MIRIILADDHQLIRMGVRSLLEGEADFEVVAEYRDGEEVLDGLRQGMKADIIFIDIKMPGIDGISLSQILQQEFPDLKIIVLSMMDHDKYIRETFNKGAKAYLQKNITADEIVFAVKHVHDGNYYICSDISLNLYKKFVASEERLSIYENVLTLTPKELSVLKLTADGNTNAEVSEILKISKRTVEGMRKNMIDKSKTKNTAGLIQYAFRTGLIQ